MCVCGGKELGQEGRGPWRPIVTVPVGPGRGFTEGPSLKALSSVISLEPDPARIFLCSYVTTCSSCNSLQRTRCIVVLEYLGATIV